jgi:phosphatidylserine/phosphatidylglycerophosphate/cardiolipin synthase-like enzyme
MSHRSTPMLVSLMVLIAVATSAVAGEHECLPTTICFTPGGNCTALIVQALHTAKRSVRVQVPVILEKSQRSETYASADFLANQGVPTLIDATHAIAHHKVIVIDGETVLTGSFNITKAAQDKHAEHVLSIQDPALAAQ